MWSSSAHSSTSFYTPLAIYGYFQNGGISCYVQSLKTLSDGRQVEDSKRGVAVLTSAEGQATLSIKTRARGANLKKVSVTVAPGTVELAESEGQAGGTLAADVFKLTITEEGSEPETFGPLTMGKGNKSIRNAVEALNKDSKLVEAAAFGSAGPRPGDRTTELLAALDRPIASKDEFVGDASARRGIGALQEIEEITLVLCPDLMSAYMRTGQTEEDLLLVAAIQKELLIHCALKQDRFAILDAPPGLDIVQMRDYKTKIANFDEDTGKYGAIYYPWIVVANPKARNGGPSLITAPPSGHIAGIYARVDGTRGVHKAPGNEAVRGAVRLERKGDGQRAGVAQPERSELYPRLSRPRHPGMGCPHACAGDLGLQVCQCPAAVQLRRRVDLRGHAMGGIRAE